MSTYAELKPINFHRSLHLITWSSDRRKVAVSLLNNAPYLHPKDVMNCIAAVASESESEGVNLINQIDALEDCLSQSQVMQLKRKLNSTRISRALDARFGYSSSNISIVINSDDWF